MLESERNDIVLMLRRKISALVEQRQTLANKISGLDEAIDFILTIPVEPLPMSPSHPIKPKGGFPAPPDLQTR